MAVDLTLRLANEPGALANAAEALGEAGINIDGVCGVTIDGEGEIHLLVEDAEAAVSALAESGVTVEGQHTVLVMDVEDQPGELGSVARKLADAGVNIELSYLATETRLVLGVDNPGAAATALAL